MKEEKEKTFGEKEEKREIWGENEKYKFILTMHINKSLIF